MEGLMIPGRSAYRTEDLTACRVVARKCRIIIILYL
jgi:hypothetical protein